MSYNRGPSDLLIPLHPLTSRKKCPGIRIRHPYICSRCRRFKLQGFHCSFPPKNFCICPVDSPINLCMSPIQLRLPSAPPKNLVATGTSVYSKTSEFSMTETALVKLTNILTHAKSRIIPSEPVENPKLESPILDEKIKLPEKFRYLVYPGNNSKLIKTIMESKQNWQEGNYSAPNDANFVWHPTSKNIKFRRLAPYLPAQVANHFECHYELSNKANLLNNLKAYCAENSLNLYEIIPVTFVIDLNSKRLNSQVLLFLSYFKSLTGEKSPRVKINSDNLAVPQPATHFLGKNIWLFKPSGNNRGRGIHIFNDAETFKSLLYELVSDSNSKQKGKKELNTFVIQKYIESPLLINSRKFDIRVWVLITSKMNCYFYKKGYIRTSSENFSIDDSTLTDQFIHLTNNAVQKEGKTYGKYEKGNQLSFLDVQEYFNEAEPGSLDFERVILRIKEIIGYTLNSVKKKLNPNSREFCFEVFGYDFIIDSEKSVWLIEVNTNPCIELSSPLLESIIPTMLSDAIALTVDPIFTNTGQKVSNGDWEILFSLKK